jgi:CRISPR/Cas system CMR-associated protein Cmr1 (group 7 of RAMP superfamily)
MLLITGHTEKVDCWLSTESEGVKKVSCWDWFDFKQIKENASLKDIYLSAKKTLSRNKDNASLEQYTPTIKETLTLLDKQHSADSQKYAMITTDSFKGLIDKPVLASALSRLLIHYESEWYGKLDSEGKLPKWEALNSEMT